jgi:hypothetical protein
MHAENGMQKGKRPTGTLSANEVGRHACELQHRQRMTAAGPALLTPQEGCVGGNCGAPDLQREHDSELQQPAGTLLPSVGC